MKSTAPLRRVCNGSCPLTPSLESLVGSDTSQAVASRNLVRDGERRAGRPDPSMRRSILLPSDPNRERNFGSSVLHPA